MFSVVTKSTREFAVLKEIRAFGMSLRSFARAVAFYALRAGAQAADTPASCPLSSLVAFRLQPMPRN